MFASDLDVGFICGADRIDRAFSLEIKEVAVVGGALGVIEHALVGDRDVKDIAQDEGGFSSGDCAGDVKGQDEAEDIGAVVDTVEIDFRFIGGGVFEGWRLKVILPVLITKFKLG